MRKFIPILMVSLFAFATVVSAQQQKPAARRATTARPAETPSARKAAKNGTQSSSRPNTGKPAVTPAPENKQAIQQQPRPASEPTISTQRPEYYKESLDDLAKFGITFDKDYKALIDKNPAKASEIYEEATLNATYPKDFSGDILMKIMRDSFKQIEAETGIPARVYNDEIKAENQKTPAQKAAEQRKINRTYRVQSGMELPESVTNPVSK